jgi:quinolinate synthase
VVEQADVVGSTTQLINAAQTMDATHFIVATDNGILHKMRMAAPGKTLIEAPTAGNSATCKSCAHCPWMAMNGLQNLADVLSAADGKNEILVDPAIGVQAKRAIDRMLDFAAAKKAKALPSGALESESTLFSNVGPA